MGRAVSLNPAFAAGDGECGGSRRGSPQVKHQEFPGTGKHRLMEGSTAEPSTKPFTHGKEAENRTSQAHLEPKPAALGDHTHQVSLGSDWQTSFSYLSYKDWMACVPTCKIKYPSFPVSH